MLEIDSRSGALQESQKYTLSLISLTSHSVASQVLSMRRKLMLEEAELQHSDQ